MEADRANHEYQLSVYDRKLKAMEQTNLREKQQQEADLMEWKKQLEQGNMQLAISRENHHAELEKLRIQKKCELEYQIMTAREETNRRQREAEIKQMRMQIEREHIQLAIRKEERQAEIEKMRMAISKENRQLDAELEKMRMQIEHERIQMAVCMQLEKQQQDAELEQKRMEVIRQEQQRDGDIIEKMMEILLCHPEYAGEVRQFFAMKFRHDERMMYGKRRGREAAVEDWHDGTDSPSYDSDSLYGGDGGMS